MLNKNKNSILPTALTVENNTIVKTDEGIAETLNNHFTSVGENMSRNINYQPSDFAQYMPEKLNKTLLLKPVNANELKEISKCLSNKNSSGFDLISQKLLKTILPSLSELLIDLINSSIREKKYPQCLKKAVITPLHKTGDKNCCQNYRPISLLSSFNKIFEKKLHNDLNNFFEQNKVLYTQQFGFRKFHSTIDALINTHDYIINEKRKNNRIVGIFIDLKKAFDSIDTKILIKKLQYYGINGPYKDLLESYLTDRTCQTKIKNILSEPKIIKFGVPQGSILGPLLFSIYINDIKTLSETSEVSLFADDTTLFCSAKDNQELEQKCNLTLEKCRKWLTSNALTLNVDKTHFVNFSKTQRNENEIILKIGTDVLSEKSDTKYLGMTLQNNLKFDKHIKAIISSINSKIPLFYQVRENIPQKKKIMIFNSTVLPNILYGIEIYAKRSNSWLPMLQKAQNRLLKILLKLNRLTNTNKIHNENSVLKVTDLCKIRSLLIGHKVVHFPEKCNAAHQNIKRNDQNNRVLRNNTNNLVITTNSYLQQNTVGENVAKLWNELNYEEKGIKNRNSFKEKIKLRLLENYS